ncbi:hypothetical protein UF32_00060, partial [Vibrio parahaemolyticus]
MNTGGVCATQTCPKYWVGKWSDWIIRVTRQLAFYIKKIAPKPKNAKKPTTSVTVVNTTEPATSGSKLNFFNVNGMNVPASSADKLQWQIAQQLIRGNGQE